MEMVGHDDIFENMPVATFAKFDCFTYRCCDSRVVQMINVGGAIQPSFHFRKNPALNFEAAIVVLPTQFLKVGANCADSLPPLIRNRAAEMNGDEVTAIGNFPMR